jgi:glycosyltransferase involved in cell wall biosynthesis
MKNILISVIVDISNDDGTTVRAKRVAEILKNHFRVTIVTRSKKNDLNLDNVNLKNIKPVNTKLWNLKVIPILIKNNYDFIYCSNDYFGFLTYYIFSWVYHYKLIFEAHSIVSEEHKELKSNKLLIKFYILLERFVIKKSDFVVALSENTFDFYKRYNKNIELVRVFVDETPLKKIKIESETRNVGLIGPFGSVGNEHYLKFLYENIERFNDNIKFIIIGECEKRIENDKIVYTGYIENYLDYMEQLSSLHAVLIPSKFATLGPLNKILEPMSCSIPVFTTPKGVVGLSNYENKENILIFKEENLVEGINESIFDKSLMEKVGKKGKEYFEKYYSKKANKKRLLKIFEEELND